MAKAPARRRSRAGERFVAKLLFQFRVVVPKPAVRRLCEERMIVFQAKSPAAALVEAKKRGRAAEFSYRNDFGDPVHFEFVGVLDLLELGIECGEDEVWYDIVERVKPMERRRKILPSEKSLGIGRRPRA